MKIIQEIKDCSDNCFKRFENINENFEYTIYHSFCFYYDEDQINECKFIIIMQNPGLPSKWSGNNLEFKKFQNVKNDYEFIKLCRDYLKEYFLNNKIFSKCFFQILEHKKLISFTDDWIQYINTHFLNDFIVSDLLKCRANTVNIKNNHINNCANKFLKNEIEKYGKGKLIFVFSSRTWEYIYCKILDGKDQNKMKVSKVHGKLFYNTEKNMFFIPLAHFSQRQFNNYLRDSYFDYLSEGLDEYIKKSPNHCLEITR